MGNIVLCRVDSRLIHGQVVTKWVNQVRANRIVVISQELEDDDFMRDVYLMAAPPNVTVDCVGIETYKKMEQAKSFANDRILMILPDIKTLKKICEEQIYSGEVQIGGLGGGPNRKVIFQNITLDNQDAKILSSIAQSFKNIYFQTIPEDSPQSLKKILVQYREK